MGETSIVEKMSKNEGLSSIIDVRVGDAHSLYLREDGSILVSGSNSHGQLGCAGVRLSRRPVECEVASGMRVRLVGAGYYSLCVSGEGEVYMWGVGGGEEGMVKCVVGGRVERVDTRHKSGRLV